MVAIYLYCHRPRDDAVDGRADLGLLDLEAQELEACLDLLLVRAGELHRGRIVLGQPTAVLDLEDLELALQPGDLESQGLGIELKTRR